MVKRLPIILLIAGFTILLVAPTVFACSCGERPTIVEQQAYGRVVVTGRIESVQKVREEEREDDYDAYRSATFLVEKVYSGNVKVGEKLVLAQGGGADCAFTWDEKSVGMKWLFYLGEPSTRRFGDPDEDSGEIADREKAPMYGTSFCGRSTPLESAAPDLSYWDNLTKRKGKTRVSGVLDFGERTVEGIEVHVTGKAGRFKTKYVKGDFFEVYEIPPGEYIVEVFAPSGWRAVENWRSSRGRSVDQETEKKLKKNQRFIRIAAGEHVDVDLDLAPDTMIKGRVLSPTNKPMANITVSAEPVDDNPNARGWLASTDTNGEFQFETLYPGNYLLVANPDGKVDDERPFGKLYYPGVAAKENAGLVAVEAGSYSLRLDIQVPQANRLIEVAGRVLFADDKPAKDIWVSFDPRDKEKFAKISARTTEDGRFTLKVPLGAVGVIAGSSYFSEYSYSKCPEIMATVKAQGGSQIKTTAVEITGDEPISTAVLRLPFDFCKDD